MGKGGKKHWSNVEWLGTGRAPNICKIAPAKHGGKDAGWSPKLMSAKQPNILTITIRFFTH